MFAVEYYRDEAGAVVVAVRRSTGGTTNGGWSVVVVEVEVGEKMLQALEYGAPPHASHATLFFLRLHDPARDPPEPRDKEDANNNT